MLYGAVRPQVESLSVTIYKYKLNLSDGQISLPRNATVLCVGAQQGEMYLWARVDETTSHLTVRTFRVYGTGHAMAPETIREFVGTIFLHDARLVFHVFEEYPSYFRELEYVHAEAHALQS